jgi:hypothetical protein
VQTKKAGQLGYLVDMLCRVDRDQLVAVRWIAQREALGLTDARLVLA